MNEDILGLLILWAGTGTIFMLVGLGLVYSKSPSTNAADRRIGAWTFWTGLFMPVAVVVAVVLVIFLGLRAVVHTLLHMARVALGKG